MKIKINHASLLQLVYRSRPAGKLEDEVLGFLSSMKTDESILLYDILGSEAHALMLFERKLIARNDLKRMLRALEEAKDKPSAIPREGFEDIHEAVEAFVISKAGAESGGKLQTGRS
ncbi:MAG TPA: hypothetical protein VFA15_01830, partial [Nitrososphaera sp.]|nr:hypothetical protein [Nitrososphaera sp.]